MRIIRFLDQTGTPRLGWTIDGKVGAINGDLFSAFRREDPTLTLEDIKLLAPLLPGKIICVGRNYAAHAKEHQVEVPEVPLLFLKPPSSIIGPDETILLPPQSQQVEHEAELAVVIGRRSRWLNPETAKDAIMGYTVANDVTARDLQRRDGQWTRGKGFDTFCPIGPWIETEFDPADAVITCKVNDELRQMASTRDMVFPVRQLVAYVSSIMTLEPGDLVLTGSPAGVGLLKNDDELLTSIEGIGELRNPVRAEQAH